MRRILTGLGASAWLLAVVASPASATDFFSAVEEEPRVMLFVHQAFGSKKTGVNAPRLGLRYERALESVDRQWSNGFGGPDLKPTHYAALVDFRLSKAGTSGLWFGQQPMLSWDSISGPGDDSLSTPAGKWKAGAYMLTGLGIIGVACLAKVWICEDDDDDGYTPPSESPGLE